MLKHKVVSQRFETTTLTYRGSLKQKPVGTPPSPMLSRVISLKKIEKFRNRSWKGCSSLGSSPLELDSKEDIASGDTSPDSSSFSFETSQDQSLNSSPQSITTSPGNYSEKSGFSFSPENLSKISSVLKNKPTYSPISRSLMNINLKKVARPMSPLANVKEKEDPPYRCGRKEVLRNSLKGKSYSMQVSIINLFHTIFI